jgi:hypothetical protein
LFYRSLGWSVIPATDKRPNARVLEALHGSPGWGRFRDVPATSSEIEAWFERDPGSGVAILTGTPSGIVVCDVEADALESAPREIVEAATAKATTPSGGLHVYFASDVPMSSRTRATTGWGDVKAEGGYVVAPGGSPDREWLVHPSDTELAPFSDIAGLQVSTSPDTTDPRGIPSPRGRHQEEGLSKWDRDQEFVEAFCALTGITAGLGTKFSCVLPGHGPDQQPSAELFRHRKTGAVLYRCWHTGRSYPLVKVYAAAVSGEPPRRFSGPTLAIWKLRLLIEAGLIERPRVEVPHLPADAPEHARIAYPGLVLLFQVRAASDMGLATPLVPNFFACWCGISESEAKEARHYFRTNGIIAKTGVKQGRADLYLPAAGQPSDDERPNPGQLRGAAR